MGERGRDRTSLGQVDGLAVLDDLDVDDYFNTDDVGLGWSWGDICARAESAVLVNKGPLYVGVKLTWKDRYQWLPWWSSCHVESSTGAPTRKKS